jgi:hypothetical protein
MTRYLTHLRSQLDAVSDAGRWTVQRKAACLALIDRGELNEAQACERFRLTSEEIEIWRSRLKAFGAQGLRQTRLQDYRARELVR